MRMTGAVKSHNFQIRRVEDGGEETKDDVDGGADEHEAAARCPPMEVGAVMAHQTPPA